MSADDLPAGFGEFCYEHGEQMQDHEHEPPEDERVERVARWLWEQEGRFMARAYTYDGILDRAKDDFRRRAREVIALIEEDQ